MNEKDTKKSIQRRVAAKLGMAVDEVEAVVREFAKELYIDVLSYGKGVLSGFGSFNLKTRGAKVDHLSGEPKKRGEKKVIVFRQFKKVEFDILANQDIKSIPSKIDAIFSKNKKTASED